MLNVHVRRILSVLVLALVSLAIALPAQPASAVQQDENGRLTISPANRSVISGESLKFTAKRTDPDTGKLWDATAFTFFAVTDPAGTVAGNAYTAGQAGTWTVTAKYGDESAKTKVTVRPGPVDHVAVNPNSLPEIVGVGQSKTFSATLYDRANNRIQNAVVVWTVSGSIGTIDQTGRFTAQRNGTGRISASAGSVVGSVDVVVRVAAAETTAPAATIPSNTNTANTNAGQVLGASESPAASPATTEPPSSSCWNIRWWGWLIAWFGFLVLLYGYYHLVQAKTGAWIWIVPFFVAAGAVVVFFFVRCNGVAGWFPWILVIGGLLVTLFRPIRFVPTDGHPL